jgi:hypothetical protein
VNDTTRDDGGGDGKHRDPNDHCVPLETPPPTVVSNTSKMMMTVPVHHFLPLAVEQKAQAPERTNRRSAQEPTCPARERVLTSFDLFRHITRFQDGIFDNLRPCFTKGNWKQTFLPTDFVAMELGPNGSKREALLHCILANRLDLIQEWFRCQPHYAHTDSRFKEIIEAAFALDRLKIALLLLSHAPPHVRCTPKALALVARYGH